MTFRPYFEFRCVLAFVVLEDTSGIACRGCHYHAGTSDYGLVIVNVASLGSYLFHFFLMNSRPFMTLEIGARLEAFATEFTEMRTLS